MQYILKVGLVVVLFFVQSFVHIASAQLSISSDREDSSYEKGETVQFLIQGESQATVDYSLFFDRFTEPLINGSISLSEDGQASIPFTFDEPGVVFCEIHSDGVSALEAVQFSFDEIQPYEEEPDDWDAFWSNQRALLTSLPMDPELTLVEETEYTTTYRLNLSNIDNRRVYGYISVPVGEGPFPAILTLPSFGDAAGLTDPQWAIAERGGAISVSVGIHNVEPDEVDSSAYAPDDISNPEGYYYRYAILGTIRIIDYLYTRPDFDGQHVGVTGISQGGGLSILVAGIDERVNLLATSKNVLGEHAANKYGRASGFPNYLRRSRLVYGTVEHETATLNASKYYDAVYAASRYDGPVFMAIGYHDIISPAATSMACYNQFSGPKILFHETNINHSLNTEEYINGRYAFFRRYFPSMQSPPWPWPETTLGYDVNAGESYSIPALEALVIQASVTIEQEVNPASFEGEWRLVEGPGAAVFSNANNYSTEVVFSEPGTYILEFSAIDRSPLGALEKYYSLADQVEVIVDSPVSTVSLEELDSYSAQIIPNPAEDYIQLISTGEQTSFQLDLIDVNGKVVRSILVQSSLSEAINVRELPRGIYFARLSAERSDQRIIKKIVLH